MTSERSLRNLTGRWEGDQQRHPVDFRKSQLKALLSLGMYRDRLAKEAGHIPEPAFVNDLIITIKWNGCQNNEKGRSRRGQSTIPKMICIMPHSPSNARCCSRYRLEHPGKSLEWEASHAQTTETSTLTLAWAGTSNYIARSIRPIVEVCLLLSTKDDFQSRMKEVLRMVTQLFWIEHTLNTRVGDEFVRSVSGREKQ